MTSEEEERIFEMFQSGKTKKKSIDGDNSLMGTSTFGLTTEIEHSEMDEIIGQGPTTSQFKVPVIGGKLWGCELLPREDLIAREDLLPRGKHYPCQLARTILKHFFVLNPATVLDLGHTTTNLSANQMSQFALAVSLEVFLASYGLLEVLLIRSRRVGAVSSRGYLLGISFQVLRVPLVGTALFPNCNIFFQLLLV